LQYLPYQDSKTNCSCGTMATLPRTAHLGEKRTACDRHQGRSLVFLEMAPTNHATEGNYINYKSLVSHKLCARASLQKSISMLSPISFSVASRMAMWIHEALETPGFEFEVLQFLTRND
jgi:hypothetical protein